MGSFANSVFNVLLGWIRGLVDGLWNLIRSEEAADSLRWVGEHWLVLAVILAAGGILLDYLIWLIRWRPYYVWRSSFSRFKSFFSDRRPREEEAPRSRGRSGSVPAPVISQSGGMTGSWADSPEQEGFMEPGPYPAYDQDPSLAQALYGRPQEEDGGYVPEPVWDEATQAWELSNDGGWPEDQAAALMTEEAEPGAWREDPAQWEIGDPDYGEDTPPLYAPQEEAPQAYLAQEPSVHPGLAPQVLQEQLGWTPPVGEEAPARSWESRGFQEFSPYDAPRPQGRRGRTARGKGETPSGPIPTVRKGLSKVVQKARSVQEALGLRDDLDEDALPTYVSPPPPKDKRHAFHSPVYPDHWRAPSNAGRDNPDFREDD